MKGHGFIAYLFQTMLHEHFHTKVQMANALGVSNMVTSLICSFPAHL